MGGKKHARERGKGVKDWEGEEESKTEVEKVSLARVGRETESSGRKKRGCWREMLERRDKKTKQ